MAARYVLPSSLLLTAVVTSGLVRSHGETSHVSSAGEGPAASVNAFIGTGTGPGPFANSGDENLFPGAVLPFGMVQLNPDTEDNGFGYHYAQTSVHGFSMTHMSGAGCPNEGEVFFTPTTGDVATETGDYTSPYSHDREEAHPGYYRVHLSRWNIDAEVTATTRTGTAQFTFPTGQTANVLVPVSHTLNHTMASSVQVVGDRTLQGYVVNQVFCRRKDTYKVFFVMRFDKPFSSFGTWSPDQALHPGDRFQEQTTDTGKIGAYVSWPAAAGEQKITAQVAISYVDLGGAENNLHAEAAGKSFDQLRQSATNTWNDTLNDIEVSGGSTRDRTVFYTALYHSMIMPTILSDADGRYLGFDSQIHTLPPGHALYGNYSAWDTYRSQMPLLAMIEPRRMEDMAQSIVLMYEQGGWIGKWPQINRYTNVMLGSPLTVVLATAWLDGLHGFDMQTAWKGMVLDATQAPPPGKPYVGEDGIESINLRHYSASDLMKRGSVSETQENSLAYASLYRLAKDLDKPADAKMFYDRALYYRNVFNPANRFFQARASDGTWVEPFDPAQSNGAFREGSGWHYQWLAPHDMAWLIHAVGPDLFNQRLNAFFDYKQPGWTGQYYNPYNETDLEAPFEYNFTGQPWRAEQAVRRVLAENYTASVNGVPGNDDCGEMSSWAVMSMMGIYSIDPPALSYELVSPVFSKVVVHLHAPYPGKTFTIETSPHPESTPYIHSVALDGHPYARNWVPFQRISAGGTLRFTLSATPDKAWGTTPADIPPSLSDATP